jgi:hypothetical protein
MRKFLLVFLLIYTISGFSLEINKSESKDIWGELQLDSPNIQLTILNNALLEQLNWPINSDINYFFKGGHWIGGKKVRCNQDGEILYWLPNASSSSDCVTQDDPEWTPELITVVDTLTTIATDGDYTLYEILPAYNPLETGTLEAQYFEYNYYDVPVKTIGQKPNYDDDNDGLVDEDEIGYPFEIPDTSNLYCFNYPSDEDGDGICDEDGAMPGFQSARSFQFDYSPFGTTGNRYFGSFAANNHISLGLAIKNEYYTWPVEEYTDIIIQKTTLLNTNQEDTIYDLCLAYYLDADIGPESWGTNEVANDDVSTYIPEEDIAYAYDADSDGGLTTGKVAVKMILPAAINHSCWTWKVGDAPDDYEPLNTFNPPAGSPTANQKYWLMRDANPDDSKYTSLRDFPNTQVGCPVDTRFLYSTYGDQQGYNNPTEESINLAPNETLEFYTLIIMDSEEEGLIEKANLASEFIDSNYDIAMLEGMKSLPFLYPLEIQNENILAKWFTYSEPDEFRIYYKKTEAPANTWEYEVLDPNLEEYEISNLEFNHEYIVKAVNIYDGIYLESNYEEIELGNTSSSEEDIIPAKLNFTAYPNPFNPQTTLHFNLPENSFTTLNIYNLRGRKIKTLFSENLSAGTHAFIWNGKNDNGISVGSGIYFVKLEACNKIQIRKLMLLK